MNENRMSESSPEKRHKNRKIQADYEDAMHKIAKKLKK
jgi:hypothetical protein